MNDDLDALAGLAILVVNYGSHEVVEANLMRTIPSGFLGQVIVVDNFSTHAEREAIAEICAHHQWTLLGLSSNTGFGGGNNRGAELAISRGATELLLVNPDAWLHPEAVRGLHEQVIADRQLQLAPTILRPDGGLYSAEVDLYLDSGEIGSRRRRARHADIQAIHTWVSGACFAISVDLWQRLGGFDEDYFLYWEDVDLSLRVWLLGGSVRADPCLFATHDEGLTHRREGESRAKSPIYYYFNARNRLVYAAKFLSRDDGRRWVRTTPRASYHLLLQGGRRQLVHPGRSLWPVLRGSIAGVRLWRSQISSGHSKVS